MQFICSDSIVKTQQQNCSISIPSIAVSDFSIVSPTDFRIIVNSNLFPETFPLIIAQFWRLLFWQFLRRPSKFFICAICTLNGFCWCRPAISSRPSRQQTSKPCRLTFNGTFKNKIYRGLIRGRHTKLRCLGDAANIAQSTPSIRHLHLRVHHRYIVRFPRPPPKR